jgi:di/tricarboxylate transporter
VRGHGRRRGRRGVRLLSDSTIFLFIGSFIIAEAMLVHGLDRRFAFNILGLRAVGDSTYRCGSAPR